MADLGKQQEDKRQVNGIPPLEWAVAVVGLLLVLSTIGYLLYQAVAGDESPPNFAFVVHEIVEREGGFLVEFSAKNVGGSAASAVMVEGVLRSGDETVETGEVTIDYIPAGSERRAGLFFTEDPAAYELVIRPLGFQEP